MNTEMVILGTGISGCHKIIKFKWDLTCMHLDCTSLGLLLCAVSLHRPGSLTFYLGCWGEPRGKEWGHWLCLVHAGVNAFTVILKTDDCALQASAEAAGCSSSRMLTGSEIRVSSEGKPSPRWVAGTIHLTIARASAPHLPEAHHCSR